LRNFKASPISQTITASVRNREIGKSEIFGTIAGLLADL